ncbi:MAG: hypothetical protein E6Q85_01035 [Thiothrix sp.]|nr:MAG: hypothetical protein E6Q85_01035 [Thiothrix sp.]
MNKNQLIKNLESKFISKKIENENKNYAGKTIFLGELVITFRTGKKTAIYPGHFIAVYKRHPYTNNTEPLLYTNYNYLIALSITDLKYSVFIFPSSTLLEQNIFSDQFSDQICGKGKTGFRVLNPHEISKKKKGNIIGKKNISMR